MRTTTGTYPTMNSWFVGVGLHTQRAVLVMTQFERFAEARHQVPLCYGHFGGDFRGETWAGSLHTHQRSPAQGKLTQQRVRARMRVLWVQSH